VAGWLITGAGGMLGTDLVSLLRGTDRAGDVVAAGRDTVDITDPAEVLAAVDGLRPDLVINCAAWTAVDAAEAHEAEALRLNGDAVRTIAGACARFGARMIHVSTDYVFDGTATGPYAEDAPCAPINAYGRGKLAGERAVLDLLPNTGYVVRTAWLYGRNGPSFVRKMLQLERERDTVDVVNDQVGQPTWSADLAAQLLALALAGSDAPAGVYHATSAGQASWCALARAIFELVGADSSRVRPIRSDQFPGPAPRPRYTVLGHDGWTRAGLTPVRPWDAALTEALPVLVEAWAGGR
jgi:dTDP-4-dehydrorhamnose reductase